MTYLEQLDPCTSKNRKELLAQVRRRGDQIVALVEQSVVVWEWARLEVSGNGHTLVVYVQRDGMKLEGARLSVSATTAQQIADRIDAMLPTPRLHDLVYQAADVKLAPITRNDWVQSSSMATTAHMIEQSGAIDAAIGERSGLVADLGKDWVVSNKLLVATNGCGPGWPPLPVGVVAANYGWEIHTGGDPAVTPGLRVLQSLGRCHDRDHVDYSQVQRLVAIACELDGDAADLRDVLGSAALAPLVSSEGALQTFRQPGVSLPDGNTPPVPGLVVPGSSSSSSSSTSVAKAAGAFALALATTLGLVWVQRGGVT